MAPWIKWVLLALGILLALACCCVLVVALAGGYTAFQFWDDSELNPHVHATVEIAREPLGNPAVQTLTILEDTVIPENDLVELAERLLGVDDVPAATQDVPEERRLGEISTFWVLEDETNRNFQVDARLAYITTHAYFWVEDGVTYEASELEALAETFENQIYPGTRAVFGSEWTPGIDNDPHLYVLYVRGLGNNIAGLFSARDSVHPQVYTYSNAREMFYFNADTVSLGSRYTYGTLTHEFQHMIHWNVDRNESTWLNEGMSELASFLQGYEPGGFDLLFMLNPDQQLTYWPGGSQSTGASYGSAFLFTSYFYSLYGEDAVRALVARPENGLESVDAVLAERGILTQEGRQATAEDFFQDWTLTNYLQDGAVGDGRYTYRNDSSVPKARPTETIDRCDGAWQDRVVHQYGTDYIRIRCSGRYSLRLEGSTEVGVLPVDAHSGEHMWWSNRGDESNMLLTRPFDLSAVQGAVVLSYWAWYDLEEDFDYVYVEASRDGQEWDILRTPRGTDENPTGSSYGWAYNGQSGGWVQEQVDLSAYAGGMVWVRFEYVTDTAVNGEGFALDDVEINALGYRADFEQDDGGWEGEGFVRISNRLPQEYGVNLIFFGSSRVWVERLELDALNAWEGEIDLGGEVREMVLVINGQTRFTNQPAGYRFSLQAVTK